MNSAVLTLDPDILRTQADQSRWEEALVALVREAAESGQTVTVSTEPRLFTPDEAAQRLSCARSTISRRIASGEIRSVKVGNRHRIPYSEVHRIWDEQMTAIARATAADVADELFGDHE
jgi:excisionase family DNA binding protein